jgi:hypothetical protein
MNDEDNEVTESPVTTMAIAQAREAGLWSSLVQMAGAEPRNWGKIIREATAMVTHSDEGAAKCSYAFERGGKMIVGPSISLAKALQAAAGKIAVRVRSSHETETAVVVDVAALDLCSMNYVEVQASRRIVNSRGQRFNEDMISVTRAAAMSIAHRNGVLRLIPDFVIEAVYQASKDCAVGDIVSIASRREKAIDVMHKAGVTDAMILDVLKLQTLDQIMADELLVLRSLYKQMRDEGKPVEEVFRVGGLMAADEARAAQDRIRSTQAPTNGTAKPNGNGTAQAKEETAPPPVPPSSEPSGEPTPEEKAKIEAREKAEAAAYVEPTKPPQKRGGPNHGPARRGGQDSETRSNGQPWDE